jgi:hypothetical protein
MTPGEQVKATSIAGATDRRGEDRRSEDANGTVTVKGPGVSAKVQPRVLIPGLLSVFTLVGGVTWWRATPAEPAQGPPLARVEALEKDVKGLRGEVEGVKEGLKTLGTKVTVQTLDTLFQSAWEIGRVCEATAEGPARQRCEQRLRDVRGRIVEVQHELGGSSSPQRVTH